MAVPAVGAQTGSFSGDPFPYWRSIRHLGGPVSKMLHYKGVPMTGARVRLFWLLWCFEWWEAAAYLLEFSGRNGHPCWMRLRDRLAWRLRERWMDRMLVVQAVGISLLVSGAATLLKLWWLR